MSVDLEGCDCNDVEREDIRVARKLHKCGACRAMIKCGEKYSYTFIVFDRESSVTKRCMRCDAIYRHLLGLLGCSETGVDLKLNCGHSYEEIHREEPPEEIARLAFLTGEEVALGLTEARR